MVFGFTTLIFKNNKNKRLGNCYVALYKNNKFYDSHNTDNNGYFDFDAGVFGSGDYTGHIRVDNELYDFTVHISWYTQLKTVIINTT